MKYLNGLKPINLDELSIGIIKQLNDNLDKNNKIMLYKHALKYSDMVSNSHCKPRGKQSNFMRDRKYPLGYPGWSGRVWVVFKHDTKSFSSNTFNNTLAHTGTGGAGLYNITRNKTELTKLVNSTSLVACSWDYKIWADDWPLIIPTAKKEHKENSAIALLESEEVFPFSLEPHHFTYEHPNLYK